MILTHQFTSKVGAAYGGNFQPYHLLCDLKVKERFAFNSSSLQLLGSTVLTTFIDRDSWPPTTFSKIRSLRREKGVLKHRAFKSSSFSGNCDNTYTDRFSLLQKLSATGGVDRNGTSTETQNSVPSTVSDTFFSGEEISNSPSSTETDSEQNAREDNEANIVNSQFAWPGKDENHGTNASSDKTAPNKNQQGSNELAFVDEYKLTDEGGLSTVTVSVGGITHRTRTNMDRVLAEIGLRAASLQKMLTEFSIRKLIRNFGKKEPGLEDLQFSAAMYEPREGVSNIAQWTATELTLQRTQMVRIARDTQYLVLAFSLFGCVRILEAVVAVFSTNPPNPKRMFEAMNALDPLTIASLAQAMRRPIVGMLDVDPTHLHEVASLKAKFWAELHKFYERQWKVMATLGIARLLAIIAAHLPSSEWVTSKLKIAWDISMALPIF